MVNIYIEDRYKKKLQKSHNKGIPEYIGRMQRAHQAKVQKRRHWTFRQSIKSFIGIDAPSIQSLTHSEKLHISNTIQFLSCQIVQKKKHKRAFNPLSYIPFWHRVHSNLTTSVLLKSGSSNLSQTTEGIIFTCSSLCSFKKFIIALKVLGHKAIPIII